MFISFKALTLASPAMIAFLAAPAAGASASSCCDCDCCEGCSCDNGCSCCDCCDDCCACCDTLNTVVVIEHHLDVVKSADHVIDLGPEGGDDGGEIVATGTPETIAGEPRSHTGRALAPLLGLG